MNHDYERVLEEIQKREPVATMRLMLELEMSYERLDDILKDMYRTGTIKPTIARLETLQGCHVDTAIAWVMPG